MGRSSPTVKVSIAEIEEAIIRYRGNVTTVATHFNCHRKTIYRRIEKSVRLKQALVDAREQTNDIVESKFHQLIAAGHWPAIKFHMVTQMKDRGYIERLPDQLNHLNLKTIKQFLKGLEIDIDDQEIIERLVEADAESKT